MLITDYRGEAMRCADTANVTAGPEAMYALGRGLLMAGLSIDDRLAQIAEALTPPIPAPQQPQERPEPAPEGDGTTDTASGREAGAQRDDHGWHTMPPGSFVIDGEDRSHHYQCRHDGTGVVHLRYKDDARQPAPLCTDPLCSCGGPHKHENGATIAAVMDVEPTPDWYRRTVEKWLDAPGHPDDRPARGELQWLLNRAEAGRPDLDDASAPAAPAVAPAEATAVSDMTTCQVREFDAGTVA